MRDFRMPIPPRSDSGDALVAKAASVDEQGNPDGFMPASFFKPEVLQGGMSRLVVSLAAVDLERVHHALIQALEPPYKVLYVKMVDRAAGTQLPKPERRVAVEIPRDRLMRNLMRYRKLVYTDGRHQLWVRGAQGEQLILEENGVVFIYPDDFLFRDVLQAQGLGEGDGQTMADRDYLRVNFDAACDAMEAGLIDTLHMLPWEG